MMCREKYMKIFLAFLLVFTLASCQSNAQRPEMLAAQARESVEKAQSVGAQEKAPLALRDASEYLSRAEEAMSDRRYDEAQVLLEKSMINSELAIARSNSASARKAAEEIEKNLDALQSETY
jgi:hypothetical protein